MLQNILQFLSNQYSESENVLVASLLGFVPFTVLPSVITQQLNHGSRPALVITSNRRSIVIPHFCAVSITAASALSEVASTIQNTPPF
jgi:hypothetical protein